MAGRPPRRTVPIMPAEPPRWACWLIAFGHALAPFAPVVVLGHLRALEATRTATRGSHGSTSAPAGAGLVAWMSTERS